VIAKTYRSGSVELLDLVQEGTLGLMRGVDRYDWRRETKFSTYAAWWIGHGIVQALAAGSRPIRLPGPVRTRMVRVLRAERELAAELGRTPSVAEIAVTLDLSDEQVLEARAAALPRSRTVIELRYGLRDGVARTADSVADELGVARERVRQVELETLRTLAADAESVAQAA
jgi:RNA polymerase nonessential primary-like sigma factor